MARKFTDDSVNSIKSTKTKDVIEKMLSAFENMRGAKMKKGKEIVVDASDKGLISKCIGLVIHMIGDTYAHRTQVPKYFSRKYDFNDIYFKDNGEEAVLFDLSDLITMNSNDIGELIKRFSTKGKEIIDIVQDNSNQDIIPDKYIFRCYILEAINYGICEFRDIKRFGKYYYLKTKDPDNEKYKNMMKYICKNYEDSSTFYPDRYNAAELVCKKLIQKIWNEEINLADIIPKEKSKIVKLYNFKAYANQDGFNINKNNVDWDSCTCYPIKF